MGRGFLLSWNKPVMYDLPFRQVRINSRSKNEYPLRSVCVFAQTARLSISGKLIASMLLKWGSRSPPMAKVSQYTQQAEVDYRQFIIRDYLSLAMSRIMMPERLLLSLVGEVVDIDIPTASSGYIRVGEERVSHSNERRYDGRHLY